MTEHPLRFGIIQDSGAPKGSVDYTTIVLLHGAIWHSTIFAKLIPIASQFNARVVTVNRQDYPVADPFTIEERAELSKAIDELKTNPLSAKERLEAHMKRQAHAICDLLVHIVVKHNIPPARFEDNTGGIIIGGWSFGATWMTALLANAASFPAHDTNLSQYVRRVVIYDTADFVLGFPTLPELYFPINDDTISPEENKKILGKWLTGYFAHGDSPEQYEDKNYLTSPPPTFTKMTKEEQEATQCHTAGSQEGSEVLLMIGGRGTGLFDHLRKNALRLPPLDTISEGDAWRQVEVRNLLCDRSLWFILRADACLRKEVEEERKAGVPLRPITFVRVGGANHFVHWDEPERAMQAMLVAAPVDGGDIEVK